MIKLLFTGIFFGMLISFQGLSQSLTQPGVPTFLYHPPSEDKESWQRLNLLLSATYYRVVKEGEVDFDSCLLYVSRSLGLSRVTVLAEGIENPDLLAQSIWIDQRNPNEGVRILSKATGKKRLEILVLLGAYYTFEPRSNYHTDSVEYFLHQAIEESDLLKEAGLKRQALCLLGKMYIQTNESPRADSVFNLVIIESKGIGDKVTEAKVLEYWASYPEFNPVTIPKRITDLQAAAKLYHELKDTEREINVLTDVGYLLVTTNQLQKAYEVFSKALQLELAIRYPYVHYNTDALAMVTMIEGKFGEPLKYAVETIRTAEITRDSIGWSGFYERLGALYNMEGGREGESLKWLLKSMDRYVMAKDPGVWMGLNDIVSFMGSQNRSKETLDLVLKISKDIPPTHPNEQIYYNVTMAAAYLVMKQYKIAESYAIEASRILKQSSVLRGAYLRSLINCIFGFIYFRDGQFERSKKYLETYLAETFGDKGFGNEILVLNRLVEIDSILGEPVSANQHYKRLANALGTSYQVSKIRQAEELQVMYQTQEKENQIVLLREQSQLAQANVKQATLMRNVTIAGIFALLIIAMLLYRQSRLRKESNQVISRKNEQLQHYLTEKEWLLKEIHHRVKNNLQIVMSLLNSQSAYIESGPALTAIHDSQHRVHAMSLIHQKLYNTDNVSSIDISVYIRELASYLSDSFNTDQHIRFEYTIDPLEMDVSQAIPLGLILNEAITNSIKYAFQDGRNGVITIALSNTSANHYLLSISDNGIGMPAHLTVKKRGSLGMSLMAGLSEDLDGCFSIETNNGTTIKITFVHDTRVKRPDILTTSFVSKN